MILLIDSSNKLNENLNKWIFKNIGYTVTLPKTKFQILDMYLNRKYWFHPYIPISNNNKCKLWILSEYHKVQKKKNCKNRFHTINTKYTSELKIIEYIYELIICMITSPDICKCFQTYWTIILGIPCNGKAHTELTICFSTSLWTINHLFAIIQS